MGPLAVLAILATVCVSTHAACPLAHDGRTTGTFGLELAEERFSVLRGTEDVELASWYRGAVSAAWVSANSSAPDGRLHVGFVDDDGHPFPAGDDPSATRDVILPTGDSTVPSSTYVFGRGAAPGCADVPMAVDMGRSPAVSASTDPVAALPDESGTGGYLDACPLLPEVALALGPREPRARAAGFALLATCPVTPSGDPAPCVFVVTLRLAPCAAASQSDPADDASATATFAARHDLLVVRPPLATTFTATAWSASRPPVGPRASRCAVVWIRSLSASDPPPGGAGAWFGARGSVSGVVARLVGSDGREAAPLPPAAECRMGDAGTVEELDAPSWWAGDGVVEPDALGDGSGTWVGRVARFAVPAADDLAHGPWSVVVDCEPGSVDSTSACVGSVALSVGETEGVVSAARAARPRVTVSGAAAPTGMETWIVFVATALALLALVFIDFRADDGGVGQ